MGYPAPQASNLGTCIRSPQGYKYIRVIARPMGTNNRNTLWVPYWVLRSGQLLGVELHFYFSFVFRRDLDNIINDNIVIICRRKQDHFVRI